MNIIMITGKQRSGKTTAAKLLAQLTPSARAYALADALKIEYYDTIFPGQTTTTPSGRIRWVDRQKQDNPEIRGHLIRLGAERRAEDPEYWCKKVWEKMQLDNPPVAIISDWRLPNESRFFGTRKGVNELRTLRIARADRSGYLLTNQDDESETALDLYPLTTVNNEGNPYQFATQLAMWLHKEKLPYHLHPILKAENIINER